MAKRKIGRNLAGLAALGAAGALASRFKSTPLSGTSGPPLKEGEASERDVAAAIQQNQRDAARKPRVTDEEQAAIFARIPGVRTSSGIPVRSGDGFLQEGTNAPKLVVQDVDEPFKKGGAVKGWGKARGARAAKVY